MTFNEKKNGIEGLIGGREDNSSKDSLRAIEEKKLREATGVSVGFGSTGNCNLNCGHCYSKPLRGTSLGYEEFLQLIDGKKVSAINFGTGENILNPDFMKMVRAAHERDIKLAVTSNGYSIVRMSDEELKLFNDVDISLDYGDDDKQNQWRHGGDSDLVNRVKKTRGNEELSANLVHIAMDKCERLGVEFSITTALMSTNYKEIPKILAIAAQANSHMRLNVFKPVPEAGIEKEFKLDYDQFWDSVKSLLTYGKLVSCSEPIVNAVTGVKSPVKQSPCGRASVRVHPTGKVVPCVYWSDSNLTLDNLTKSFEPAFATSDFKQIRVIPDYCKEVCPSERVDVCGGGCASRRYLSEGVGINNPDEYCPWANGREVPNLPPVIMAKEADLVHSAYLCTFIWDANVPRLIEDGYLEPHFKQRKEKT